MAFNVAAHAIGIKPWRDANAENGLSLSASALRHHGGGDLIIETLTNAKDIVRGYRLHILGPAGRQPAATEARIRFYPLAPLYTGSSRAQTRVLDQGAAQGGDITPQRASAGR